jgi:hypothetical protein
MKQRVISVFQLKLMIKFIEQQKEIFDIPTGVGKAGFQGIIQQHQN